MVTSEKPPCESVKNLLVVFTRLFQVCFYLQFFIATFSVLNHLRGHESVSLQPRLSHGSRRPFAFPRQKPDSSLPPRRAAASFTPVPSSTGKIPPFFTPDIPNHVFSPCLFSCWSLIHTSLVLRLPFFLRMKCVSWSLLLLLF